MNYISKLNWVLISEGAYLLMTIVVCLRIIYDTRSTTKTVAYLLFAIFVPVVGILVYFAVGTNFRLQSLYKKKLTDDEALLALIQQRIVASSRETMQEAGPDVQHNKKLSRLLVRESRSPLVSHNRVTLLINGENKFAELVNALRQARHHIHMEYYHFEDDRIGNTLKGLLIQKAREGVQVRFIYDDFGSRSIRRKLVPELRAAGVQAYPFYKLTLPAFAQRLNYRNHRKIVVIDGYTSFVGGINVCDRYVNWPGEKDQTFWRDTHLRIDGLGTYFLQHLFLCDWNFCATEKVALDRAFFGDEQAEQPTNGAIVQIGASGPDSRHPSLLFSFLQAISSAEQEILITTPYFIPGDSLLDALMIAAMSGVTVKLLVPDESDSLLVNEAACSYYNDLLSVGVEVYRYKKGFVHAKTMVTDGTLAVVGTANMDYRSFDLNFEVAAFVYDTTVAGQLSRAFHDDLTNAVRIDPDRWLRRPILRQLAQKIARMVAPLL